MNQIVKSLKKILRASVESTPILRDFYYYHWLFPRNPNLYRGVFKSFAEASAAIPTSKPSGYDLADLHNSSLKQNLDLEEIGKFKQVDYPVLVWLAKLFKDRSTVFDLGGNTGYSYYAYSKYIDYPPAIQWSICDVPAAVRVGNELLQRFNSPGLSYTTNIADAEGFDIFLTCGTLQYLEPSLSELLSKLQSQPQHLIINHVPFHNGDEYITLQNLLVSYAPYKIQNRELFIDSIEKLGYELVDSWQQNRTCSIPFKPERFVDAYHGFYFRLQLLKT